MLDNRRRTLQMVDATEKSSCSDETESEDHDEDREQFMAAPPLWLRCDTYDGLMMATVTLYDKDYIHRHGGIFPVRMQFVMSLLKHMGSITLQFLLLFLLYETSVAEEKTDYGNYGDMYSLLSAKLATRPATMLNSTINFEQHILEFCERDNTVPKAHFIVLLLWFLKMVAEIQQVFLRSMILLNTPSPSTKGVLLTREKDAKDVHTISFLGCAPRVLSFMFIMFPHVGITLFSAWTGARFLMVTPSMVVLIFKAVGLGYVLTINSLVFEVITPHTFKYRVSKTKFDYGPVFARYGSFNWHMWGSGLSKVIVIFVAAWFTQRVAMSEVCELRMLCVRYLVQYPSPNCFRCGFSIWQHLTGDLPDVGPGTMFSSGGDDDDG